eukprot:GHVN01084470.1.p1 GENE.GHVN01084470.1~~GHVN01084470.1.p1  ORF type:complete len:193 (+),score=38.87 GHVN01084470.1:40-579(+)
MARRFLREGRPMKKHADTAEEAGMRNWVADLTHRTHQLQYRYWMSKKARQSILSGQDYADDMMRLMTALHSDSKNSCFKDKFSASQPSNFYFRTAIPNSVPFRKSTNPFCRVSSNKTGWEEAFPDEHPVNLQPSKLDESLLHVHAPVRHPSIPHCKDGWRVGGLHVYHPETVYDRAWKH